MGYRIVIAAAIAVAQAPAPAPKAQEKAPAAAASDQALKDAQRLLQNGRYAEAEEALSAILTEAKKEPARLTPARKRGRAGTGRMRGQPGRAWQGDRTAQGGRG